MEFLRRVQQFFREVVAEFRRVTWPSRADVANCSITSYAFDPAAGRSGKLVLALDNFVAPLTDAGAPVTREPDVPAAPKS